MTNDKNKLPISEEKALARMMRICSRKEYCTNDIKQKLRQLQIDNDTTERIIDKLYKNKFIDDERFTRSYINDKLRFSKWGKTKIIYNLRCKKIDDKIIDNSFKEFSNKQLNQELESIVARKLKSVKDSNDYNRRNKVIRHALGRGFAMDDIIQCLNNLSNKEQ